MQSPRFVRCSGALLLASCLSACAPEAPPAEAEGEAAAPGRDEAQIQQLVLVNRMLASQEMAVLGAYGHASVRSSSNPDPRDLARRGQLFRDASWAERHF